METKTRKTQAGALLLPSRDGRAADRAQIRETLAAAGLPLLLRGEGGCPAVFLWPEDAPLCAAGTLKALLDSLEGYDALRPVCRGVPGWPLLLRGEFFQAVTEGLETMPPEAALRAAGCRQGYVPVGDFLCTRRAESPEDRALMDIYAAVPCRGVPDEGQCRALLEEQGTLPHIVRHCAKTAQVAEELALGLKAGGYELDLGLVRAGALLHDILRLTPPHAMNGALLLARRGFFETAEVVRWHMDLPLGREGEVNEAAVVFLADKLAMEDRRVSLRRRHENSCVKARTEAMRAHIWDRFQLARITEKAIAAALEMEGDVL